MAHFRNPLHKIWPMFQVITKFLCAKPVVRTA